MSAAVTGDWFITVSGEQKGPVSREELAHLAEAGAIHPRNDMVWQQGMDSWVAAGELEGLFRRKAANEAVEPTMQMAATATNPTAIDPYAATAAASVMPGYEAAVTTHWPGMGRGGFFMSTMVLPTAGQAVLAFLAVAVGGMLGDQGPMYISLGGSIAMVMLVLYGILTRFPNLGMSRWWTLGLLVPLLNWWVQYRLFACPPGYAAHKKLDTLGWVLAVFYWLSILATLIMCIVLIVMVGAAFADPDAWQKFLDEAAAGGTLGG